MTGTSTSATAGSAVAKASVATSTLAGGTETASSASRTRPTASNTSGDRAKNPMVSKLGDWVINPSTGMRPWVGRKP